MLEKALFPGKFYTAGTNFTRPPVATAVTNLNSGAGAHSICSKIFEILIGSDGGVLASTSHQEKNIRDVCLQIFLAICTVTEHKGWNGQLRGNYFGQFQIYEENVIKSNLEKFILLFFFYFGSLDINFRTKMYVPMINLRRKTYKSKVLCRQRAPSSDRFENLPQLKHNTKPTPPELCWRYRRGLVASIGCVTYSTGLQCVH